ncbi:bacterio-opsin activator domain-containing protein [Halococcus saccharolyticus]|uniref:Putative PAS/PAC sensor protein n=1 Tax=Halococcus saccharolyticus DSM 5350 TaxID=1227455 RepID=M0MHZ8_9EURY|nr:bacterio-opsin activator domain-containing protein [Halococcus saccharolyticus]EMA45352.1 putative PAS/PAC sensor protein [Halococcus saccharolyticus DSM 5350]
MATAADTLAGSHVLLVGTAEWTTILADALEAHGSSVRTVATADAATAALDDHPVECVVSEYALDERTGLELLRTVRDETATLPVVLCTAAGSETIASEAIAAGVTDYVAITGPFETIVDDVLTRLGQAVRTAERTDTRHDRARQFDATFHDDRTATWVLDPDGSLRRANSTARGMVAADAENATEEPFWTLPWWTDGERAIVERTIEHAIDGRFDSSTVTREHEDGTPQTLDLSARPVRDETGTVVSVVVEGVDVTERVSLERDLRESEELHRVTLNNMTDTVLITDDDGAFTYVCPNVHFIFGYTAEEIHDLGSIESLLGSDLFDRNDLAAEGVLKNIECTATDKAGREHTLLVNVREVSIQGGTLLYSCRDITKRKRREEALAGLHTTTRDLQYAGTDREIAHIVVDDAAAVLDLDASAVYLFNADENALEPVAASNGMGRLDGPLPTRRANDETIPGHTFVADDARFYDDVHDADRLANEATGIRSGAYIPLGEHGVFVAAAGTVGAFDDVLRELTDLLAATAEAALDRVERESRLREQERELQRRNAQLTRLDGLNEIIREIDGALVRAETREEIDRAVCELLTAEDRFAFAWIGDVDPTSETLEPRAWAGTEQGYLDSVSLSVGTSGAGEPAGQAAATREVQTVSNVADRLREAPWRSAALTRDYLSVLSVPLAHDDFEYGVLTVYAETANAFDGTARAVLAELGETIASATSAVERKNALLTTANTRLEFETRDSGFVFARLARRAECTLSYQGGVQRTADGVYVFVTVTDTDIEDVVAAARELVSIADVERIGTDDEAGVLRLRLSQPFLALDLADHGAVLRRATADGETATLVVDVPNSVDVRRIDRLVAETFTDVELLSKRSVDRASSRDLHAAFLDRLTDRQLEVLQTAYYSGYFESPRESTGEEIAATLGISPPAFYRHARTVQRKLFTVLFDDIGVPSAVTAG